MEENCVIYVLRQSEVGLGYTQQQDVVDGFGRAVGVKGCLEWFMGKIFEKEMAAHVSVLAWRIPGTVGPGGLPSMGSHRVRHD